MFNKRILVPLAAGAFGFHQAGISGAFWCLFIFGFGCFIWYTLTDAGKAVGNFMKPTLTVNNNVKVESDGLPGHPDVEGTARRMNPDPTRPDMTDDFMGLITYKLKGGPYHHDS